MTCNDHPLSTVSEVVDHMQNDSRTCEPRDTGLTQPRSPPVRGFTYFVRDGDMIKIGSSMSPKSRITSLQTASPRPLETMAIVPMDIADEFGTHRKFSHLRVRGEWFRAEPDLLRFIESVKARIKRRHPPGPSSMTRRLTTWRREHGPQSAIGHRCSNLMEAIPIYQASTDPNQKAGVAKSIGRWTSELAVLLNAAA